MIDPRQSVPVPAAGDASPVNALVPVRGRDDILPAYRRTPVGDLLGYHNLGEPLRAYQQAELLVAMCMDHRVMLRIPDNFAFVVRAAGANLQRMEFKVSFAVAVGGVRTIAVVGHEDCGMVGLRSRRQEFVDGLVENGGWDRSMAEEHFAQAAPVFEVRDAAAFVVSEARRLRVRYPRVTVAPLFFRVRERLLYQITEDEPEPGLSWT